ncbi:hypothetical protein ABIE52_000446 [Rhodococcus sp. OAS809]|jgi:hypothetical protein|uniref:DUF4190 domain-containing protein n=1 Tax=Rhodococcus TaxID=1827 RepID=UPI0002D9F10A|nr:MULTISPECIES: DUF4190 domain-containing protein [Rhodococcus]OQM78102.1 hypothetical protein B0E55_06002 [Rhodococcus sp. 66b]ORI27797.1 hypothetical protein BH686_05440 [Rhodococcus erythropolis]
MSTSNLTPTKTNTLAVLSLAASILSFVTFVFILSIGGIVAGKKAQRQIATSGEGGAGIAKAGVVIGWVSLIWGILGVIALAVFWRN